jgi:hypothetical protein
MNRNSNFILFAMIVSSLAGCGGGGGGSPTDSPDEDPPVLNIHDSTAEDTLTLGFGLPEGVLQLAQSAATGVYELTRPLVQTPLELECENDEGRRILSYIDNDSSGTLSAGDALEIRFDNCFDSIINDLVPNGVLRLTLTQFSIDGTGVLMLAGQMAFTGFAIQNPSGDSILVRGNYEIEYELSRLSETLTARTNGDESVEFDFLSIIQTLSHFSVTKNSSFPLTQYTYEATGRIESDTLGFAIECETESPYIGRTFSSTLNKPFSGSFSCSADDGSSVRLAREDRVLVDPDGNGSMDLNLGSSSPEDYLEGFALSGPTHYPKSLVVDFNPTLTVSHTSAHSGKMAYDPVKELLYISQFSGISVYDPNTGHTEIDVIDTSGNEPAITLSPDGSMIYLQGTNTKWYSLPDGVSQGTVSGPTNFYDLAVSPANPEIFAVAGGTGNDSLILYQDGAAFPNSLAGENVDVRGIAFNDTGDKIYAYTGDGRVIEIAVVADGVDVAGEVAVLKGLFSVSAGAGVKLSYKDGYIQFANGWRVDVAGKRVVGQFGPPTSYDGVLIDSSDNRAYTFFDFETNNGVFHVYELSTMRLLSRYQLLPTGVSNNLGFDFGSAVDMGANGIAVTIKVDNQNFVYVVNKAALADQDRVLCNSQNFEGLIGENSLKQVYCEFKDIVYSAANNKLYATTPPSFGQVANSLLVIDPDSGNIEDTRWLGSEPDKLALSKDNAILYVTLKKEASVLALDALTLEPVTLGTGNNRFWLGTNPDDLVVIPTAVAVSPTDSLAVSVSGEADAAGANDNVFLGHYVNGSRRPDIYSGFHSIFQSLHFSEDGSILYALREFSTWLDIFAVDGAGVNFTSQSATDFLSAGRVDVQGDDLLDREGRLINLPGMTVTGVLENVPALGFSVVMNDAANGYIYAFDDRSNSADYIYRYDTTTLQRSAKLEVSGFPRDRGASLKLLDLGPQKIGLAWEKRLDILDKADFVPCQDNADGICE